MVDTSGIVSDPRMGGWRYSARRHLYLLERFGRRYGRSVFLLVAAALLGWFVANSVSNYTHGGWELHVEQRLNQSILVNIHFHHWYYGLPLYLLALLLVELQTDLSIFVFAFGQALAAHSFINEGGIPSILEGGETWRIAPEIYFPIVTGLCFLYAFFLLRREEWLSRASEREEIAVSYTAHSPDLENVLARLDGWGARNFHKRKSVRDPEKRTVYGQWRALDPEARGEWQMHYAATPFDETSHLLVVRLEHVPLRGRIGKLDELVGELDQVLGEAVEPAVTRALKPGLPNPENPSGEITARALTRTPEEGGTVGS